MSVAHAMASTIIHSLHKNIHSSSPEPLTDPNPPRNAQRWHCCWGCPCQTCGVTVGGEDSNQQQGRSTMTHGQWARGEMSRVHPLRKADTACQRKHVKTKKRSCASTLLLQWLCARGKVWVDDSGWYLSSHSFKKRSMTSGGGGSPSVNAKS